MAGTSRRFEQLVRADATLPRSPADLPITRIRRANSQRRDDIVYVEYEMPGPSRMPFSAAPNKDGHLLDSPISESQTKSRGLIPRQALWRIFLFPTLHGRRALRRGSSGWFGMAHRASPNKLGKWDPKTQKITEYQAAYLPARKESSPLDRNTRFASILTGTSGQLDIP